jgi:hypothetical protein
MLTQEQLKERLYYDRETGHFYWRFGTKNRLPWRRAGTMSVAGYVTIRVGGTLYYAHRLAVLYMTGVMPKRHTDHINGIKTDNRWENLRTVDFSVNQQNRKRANVNSSSGLLGVSLRRGKYRARIHVHRNEIHLGDFASAEEAHRAYIEAKRNYHAEGNTL